MGVDWLRQRRFDRLVEPLLGDLGRFSRRLARDPNDAEDLLQEGLLAGFRRCAKLRNDGAFRVWMFRTIYSVHLDRVDREARHRKRVEAGRDAQIIAFPRSPADQLESRELGEALARAIDSLPEAQREALWLVDVQGFSFTETADVLGQHRGTVASRVARARATLRGKLEDIAREQGVIR